MTRAFLLLAGAVLVLGAATEQGSRPIILNPTEAATQGRELAAKILSQRPARDFTNTGTLKIRDAKGRRTEIPVKFEVLTGSADWRSTYQTFGTNAPSEQLGIDHGGAKPSRYRRVHYTGLPEVSPSITHPEGNEVMTPFAGSDFWLADLGLEFFHWPEQRLLRKELRRGQSCYVLESVNPHPASGAYSRVVSWIDIDTDGIINADAYDAQGRLLKQFAAKSFKKIRGEWELQEIEMLNRQNGSRTSIEFHLSSK